MKFTETALKGYLIVEAEPAVDERGYFARVFCAREFAEHGLNPHMVQASVSYNPAKGTLRGLHFEGGSHMEDKLVSCPKGAIFDVAVDLRPDSPTFGRWVGAELTGDNHRQLYLPKGFAHGFQTLADDTVVGYHIAQFFEPGHSAGVVWNDPDIGVDWPLPPVNISGRDRALPRLRELDPGLLMPGEGR